LAVPQNAKDEESTDVDGPREQCDTDSSHGSPAGRWARHLDTLWRCGAELDLAVEAGAAPVVLLRQTPFYHAPGSMRCGARLESAAFAISNFMRALCRRSMTPPEKRGF